MLVCIVAAALCKQNLKPLLEERHSVVVLYLSDLEEWRQTETEIRDCILSLHVHHLL